MCDQKIELCRKHLAGIYSNDVWGVFVTGSFARGAANEQESDVDLLVIVDDGITFKAAEAVSSFLSNIPERIDAVAVKEKHVGSFPTEIEFLVKPGRVITAQSLLRKDFVLTQQDAYECGIQIGGRRPDYTVPPVPFELLEQGIRYLFPFLRTRFKNPALSLCRAAFTMETGALCSKAEAGRWALCTLSGKYAELITDDLAAYTSGKSTLLSSESLANLENEIGEKYGLS